MKRLFAGVGAIVGGLWLGLKLIDARAQAHLRRRAKERRSAPLATLVKEAQAGVLFGGWERLREGSAILERVAWTEAGLLDALDALWAVLGPEDERLHRVGPWSNRYSWHDGGLAGLCEALRHRLGLADASDPST